MTGPVPVHAFSGAQARFPSLALGSLLAFARHHGVGGPDSPYALRRQTHELDEVLADLVAAGPGVVLFSNYLWTREKNLAAAAVIREASPETLLLHGGPHTPHYEVDNQRFFADHPQVDVTVRREGEVTLAAILDALDGDIGPRGRGRLEDVPGLVVRTVDGPLVRTPDPERIVELAELPSAYLSGEMDHLHPADWGFGIIETNRGCPYGCTFCDWGQATLSRIRKFPMERVLDEITWLAEHRVRQLFIADANFGIMKRDLDVADHIVAMREEHGFPLQVVATFTKNTNRHVREIIRRWIGAGMWSEGVLSLQTTDPGTLQVIRRKNIKTERYEELAAEFRELGLPVATDLILGLPGASVDSFATDLQYFLDRHISVRLFEAIMLPNSPMNEPTYREENRIEVDGDDRLVSTATYSAADHATMRRLRYWFRAFEDLGVLRQLLRFVQVEADWPAMEVVRAIDAAVEADPSRYPLLGWLGHHLDQYLVPPGGWAPFYAEVARFLAEERGLDETTLPGLSTVLAVETALRPDRGRTFPVTVPLEHDFVAYAARHLGDLSQPTVGAPRLADEPPGVLVVDDPDDICGLFLRENALKGHRWTLGDNPYWWDISWELESPLARPLARPAPAEPAFWPVTTPTAPA